MSYISRILEADGMGMVAYAQNIVSYFVMFASLGLLGYGTREVARVRETRRELDTLFSELILLNVISTAVYIACYAVLIKGVFADMYALYIAVGLELFFNFLNVEWFYQGMEDYGFITARSLMVKAAALAMLFLFVNDRQDYIIYALIHSAGAGLNYGISCFSIRKRVRLCWHSLNLKRHLKPIAYLMIGIVSATLYSKVDVTMLGAMVGNEPVAYYTNALRVIGIVMSFVTAVSGVFMPRLSYAFANEKHSYAQYVNTALKIVVLLAVPACAGVVLVADDAVTIIFGYGFLQAAKVLQILSVLTIIKSVGDLLCYQVILSSGNEQKLIKSRVLGAASNIMLNAILIPDYGHVGAAVASVISELIVNVVLLPDSMAIVRVRIEKSFFFSAMLSCIVMMIFVILIQHIGEPGLVRFLMSVVAGILAYGVMLGITKNDMLVQVIKSYRKFVKGKC
ncbi:MAG: flippase [Eubacterium sp.]|nr:flippase [Eubacterium sp.]